MPRSRACKNYGDWVELGGAADHSILHRLGFAQANNWSKLQIEPTTRHWMSVLIKWVKPDE